MVILSAEKSHSPVLILISQPAARLAGLLKRDHARKGTTICRRWAEVGRQYPRDREVWNIERRAKGHSGGSRGTHIASIAFPIELKHLITAMIHLLNRQMGWWPVGWPRCNTGPRARPVRCDCKFGACRCHTSVCGQLANQPACHRFVFSWQTGKLCFSNSLQARNRSACRLPL